MDLLREYVRAIVERAMKPFSFREFKDLFDPEYPYSPTQFLVYAQKRLPLLGSGTARETFRLSSTKVLKIAKNSSFGREQNRVEVDTFTNPSLKPITTRIFNFHDDYLWLISELVRPIESWEEFESLTGVHEDVFIESMERESILPNERLSPEGRRFLESAITLVKSGLFVADLTTVDHWGKTADGRVVILDYGFNDDVSNMW